MKTRWVLAMVAVGSVFARPARGGGEHFIPGHVFVSGSDADACAFGGPEAIVEIDPATGAASLFDDPLGSPSSLVFDSAGNLFVGSSGWILRYDNADPASRRTLIAEGKGEPGGRRPLPPRCRGGVDSPHLPA